MLICLLIFGQLHPAFADPIHNGAATDVQMLDGSTALHWAAYGGNIEIITELLAHNANPNIRNAEGLTPYEMAEKYGHQAAAMLVEKAMVAGNA